jgi:hypothetical protein
VELSSVKAMEVTRPTSWLPTEPKQRFKTKATRSRYSTAINGPTRWCMIEKPAGGVQREGVDGGFEGDGEAG